MNIKKLFFIGMMIFATENHAQQKAAVHFQNGKTEHLFIRRQILQEDEQILTSKTLNDKRKKISLDEVKYLAVYPSGTDKDSTFIRPVNVFINPKKSVKRWLVQYYQSPNIAVFYGLYAKGLGRTSDALYYYENSGVYPTHYLYLKRRDEKEATIWWSQEIDFNGNIPEKQKIKFIERTSQYFSDAPELQKMLSNGQLSPRDWKQIIVEYEMELKNKKSSPNKKFL